VTDTTEVEADFTIFSTTTCGPCLRLKQRLVDLGIPFTEINIETDDRAAAWVAAVNDGDRVVPTLGFADGSVLTNPSVQQVLDRLSALTE
jgi:mycoredoxin